MPFQDKNPHRTDVGGKFRLGETKLSDGVRAIVDADPIAAVTLNAFVRCHQNGQWGSATAAQVQANEQALQDGGAVSSTYSLQGRTIRIVTDAEPRETTRVFLSGEAEAPQ
jgi:hypothetical protein